MKSTLQIVALILTIHNASPADTNGTYGVKAGMNVASSGELNTLSTASPITSFTGGLFAEYQLSNCLAVEPELLFTRKGSHIFLEGLIVKSVYGTSITQTLDYLEVPILVKLQFAVSDHSLEAYVGPSIAWLMAASQHIDGWDPSTDYDFTQQAKPIDLGIVAGCGITLFTSPINLSLDLRIEQGVREVPKRDRRTFNRVLAAFVAISI